MLIAALVLALALQHAAPAHVHDTPGLDDAACALVKVAATPSLLGDPAPSASHVAPSARPVALRAQPHAPSVLPAHSPPLRAPPAA